MKVFISADIEGVTGVVAWSQAGRPHSDHYDWAFARRMMTHDVNSAVKGLREAGATQIVIKDSHGTSRNLLIDELEPGVELISGMSPHPNGMMTGLDASFDAALLIGYHGMAGTLNGVMEHTITGSVHRFSINGKPSGEIALSAATAGSHGVPLVMVSSDDAGCKEARELIPGIQTAITKEGMGRFIGKLKHPSVTGPVITQTARTAIQNLGSVKPWVPSMPVVMRIEHNTTDQAGCAALLPGWERIDAYTTEYTGDEWNLAHRQVRLAMEMALNGGKANQ